MQSIALAGGRIKHKYTNIRIILKKDLYIRILLEIRPPAKA